MPESEIFKVIIQLGSFGLLAIAVVWMLYYGAPMIRDTVKGLAESHQATEKANIEKYEAIQRQLSEKIESAVMTLSDRHERAVATLVGEQTKLVQQMDANCRQERIQMAELLAKTMPVPAHRT